MTKEEEIQAKYLDLIKDVKGIKHTHNNDIDLINTIQDRTDELFKNVTKTSEMNLDARVIKETNQIQREIFEKSLDSQKISTMELLTKVSENKSYLDALSKQVLKNYRGVSFFRTVDLSKIKEKTTGTRKRTKKPDLEEEGNTKMVVGNVSETKEKDFMTKEILNIQKSVLKNKKIDFYELVIDTENFSKSVQNIFHLSFALRLGYVDLLYEDEKYFVVENTKDEETEEGAKRTKVLPEKRHLIFTIDYEEFDKIRAKLLKK